MSCGKTGAQAFNALFREDLTGLMFGIERFGQRFDKGEKVMQVVENRVRGTYTGDVGVITEIDRKEGELYVRYGERIVCYAFEELDELVQAYAVTVDKVRGNEFPGVIIPFSMEQSVVLRREVLYTAVTRAKAGRLRGGSRGAGGGGEAHGRPSAQDGTRRAVDARGSLTRKKFAKRKGRSTASLFFRRFPRTVWQWLSE